MKDVLMMVTLLMCFPVGEFPYLVYKLSLNAVIALAIVFSILSFVWALIPAYWYANILSMLNFTCGLLGVFALLKGYQPIVAVVAIFCGQALDLFDGRAANKWGSTPIGEYLDDIADATSFGACVALLIMMSFDNELLGFFSGIAHVSATLFRLVRFLVHKKADKKEGGVTFFAGLPSPAAAFINALFTTLPLKDVMDPIVADMAKMFVVVLMAMFQISSIAYPHPGRALTAWMPRRVILAGFTGWFLFTIYHFQRKHYAMPFHVLLAPLSLYLCLPIYGKKFGMVKANQEEFDVFAGNRELRRDKKREKRRDRRARRARRRARGEEVSTSEMSETSYSSDSEAED
ncbi:CDP-alcohol phosphatidyltransferase [Kipferlia bialata]|uniref:CDP-alcohol phosphatidyltransferase n=1 Tax=Kipferlia bialata TaxID=797122 RepID=A0A9K3D4A7_9EUKA|nr:CDP-alcohol phosphatidyltransferase [Kipferlia bialata]|eukprot:g9775.t1